MSVEVALGVLKFARDTWYKIPQKDRDRMIQAVKEKNIPQAIHLAAKYHMKFKNPTLKNIHCKICGKAIARTAKADFKTRMEKLRNHRRRMHKKGVKKAVETRKRK